MQGFVVVIAPMPLNLAVFDPNVAGEVIQAFPEVKTWAVGGHSLGGSMAAAYAAQHPDAVQGVVLWASYPSASDNLAKKGVRILSISGTRDGLATPQKIEESRRLLPADTVWLAIEGGNHAQFGWYGAQQGDHPAEIERSVQQAQIVAGTVDFLKSLEER